MARKSAARLNREIAEALAQGQPLRARHHATTKYIPGQEYEFATVDQIKDRIDHLTWILSPGRYQGPGRGDLVTELEMLKYQWLGNARVREREMGTRSHATKDPGRSHADPSNYARLARDVPAARTYKPSKWSKSDRDALSKVLTYAEKFARNQGLRPVHPHLVPSGGSNFGQVYNSLGLKVNERNVAVFSSYDNARAAVVIAEQAARASGVEVP